MPSGHRLATAVRWLFLYASPWMLNPPAAAEYWTTRAQNIETAYIGAGLYCVQEDQPYAIGRAISCKRSSIAL